MVFLAGLIIGWCQSLFDLSIFLLRFDLCVQCYLLVRIENDCRFKVSRDVRCFIVRSSYVGVIKYNLRSSYKFQCVCKIRVIL